MSTYDASFLFESIDFEVIAKIFFVFDGAFLIFFRHQTAKRTSKSRERQNDSQENGFVAHFRTVVKIVERLLTRSQTFFIRRVNDEDPTVNLIEELRPRVISCVFRSGHVDQAQRRSIVRRGTFAIGRSDERLGDRRRAVVLGRLSRLRRN